MHTESAPGTTCYMPSWNYWKSVTTQFQCNYHWPTHWQTHTHTHTHTHTLKLHGTRTKSQSVTFQRSTGWFAICQKQKPQTGQTNSFPVSVLLHYAFTLPMIWKDKRTKFEPPLMHTSDIINTEDSARWLAKQANHSEVEKLSHKQQSVPVYGKWLSPYRAGDTESGRRVA